MSKVFSVAALIAFLHLTAAWAGEPGAAPAAAESPLPGESLYQLDSTWTTQDGKDLKLSSLRGAPVVVAMVYTSCRGACPMTIADLKRIEGALPEAARKQARFAVFSFDSERDTPAALKRFAVAHALDLSRWTLFHGSPSAVRMLGAALGIRYKKLQGGDFDHSNVITVVDRQGVIQYQQIGLSKDPQEAVAKLKALGGAGPSVTGPSVK